MQKVVQFISKDKKLMEIVKNSGILFSGDAITSFFGLIALSITTMALGPEKYGMFVLIQTYVLMVDKLLKFQSWQGLIKYGAERIDKNDYDGFKGFVKLSIIFDLISAIVGTLVAIFAAYWVGKLFGWTDEAIKLSMISSVVILFNLSGAPTGILRLFNKFKLFAIQQMACSVLYLVAVSVAFLLGGSLSTYVTIWVITTIFGNIVLLIAGQYVLNNNQMKDWWNAGFENWKPFFSFSMWTNLTSSLDIPTKQLDVFIVSAVISTEGVAIYNVIKQSSLVISKFADPVYQTVYPEFAYMIANKEMIKAVKMIPKMAFLILLITIPITIIISLTSPWWLNHFFGEIYASNWMILSTYLIFRTISTAFVAVHPLFVAMGLVKKNIGILLIANSLYLLFAWYLGYNIGLLGLVLAYFIQFSTVLVLKLYHINYNIKIIHKSKEVI